MTIGTLIKQQLRTNGMKQQRLVELTGLSKNTISLICNDRHRPTPENLDKICQALKVKVSFSFEPIES